MPSVLPVGAATPGTRVVVRGAQRMTRTCLSPGEAQQRALSALVPRDWQVTAATPGSTIPGIIYAILVEHGGNIAMSFNAVRGGTEVVGTARGAGGGVQLLNAYLRSLPPLAVVANHK